VPDKVQLFLDSASQRYQALIMGGRMGHEVSRNQITRTK